MLVCKQAILAQLVEQHFCKMKVPGSIPGDGSQTLNNVQIVEKFLRPDIKSGSVQIVVKLKIDTKIMLLYGKVTIKMINLKPKIYQPI